MARESPAEQIQRLLHSGDAAGAMRAADDMLAKLPTSPVARLGRCQALLMMRKFAEAEADLEIVLKALPKDELANYLRGKLDILAGRADDGIARLRPIARGRGPCAVEAMLVLLDICFNAGRRAEWTELMKIDGAWRKDIRAELQVARAVGATDPIAGAAALLGYLRGNGPRDLRRRAGFEAAGLLDKAGDYRGAFDAAHEAHRRTGDDFDLDLHLKPILEQAARIEKGERWVTPQSEPVEGVAFLVSLPRTGSTLIEQMLDLHPAVSGIGEYQGLTRIAHELRSQPAWPRRPGDVPRAAYAAMQTLYLDGARRVSTPGARWTLDKTLRSWRALPEIAAVLPGAACISVQRDPRDTAVSLFLSYFDTGQIGWNLSFQAIRQVIAAQQRIVPRAFEVLGIAHASIVYEDLVDRPADEAARCLAALGLGMDERVLSPEQNTRTAVTLSSMQVQKPINRSSIGHWRNYAFAFDGAWDRAVTEHESRRRNFQ